MQEKELKIKAKDEQLQGVYANLMQVFHTKEEFVLDFFLNLPPQGRLCARVIVSPPHLKRVIKALKENLEKYEEKFGQIKENKIEEKEIGFKA